MTMLCFSEQLFSQKDSIASTLHVDEVEVLGIYNPDNLASNPRYSIANDSFHGLNITDVTSAMRRLPGVNLRDYGGAGGLKTISVRGLGAQHTGVMLDGLMLSDLQSGSINLQQFALSEMSSLSLSVMNEDNMFVPARSFSYSSVLSILTSDTIGSSVKAETGSWNYYSVAGRTAFGHDKARFSVSGGYVSADNDYPFTVQNGVATHRERRVNSGMKQGYASASALWNISANTSLKLLTRLSDDDRELPGIVRYYTNENDETLRDRSASAQLQLAASLSSRLKMKSAVRWNWAEQNYHNGLPSGGIKSEDYMQREYYATTAFLFNALRNVDVDYSADFFRNEVVTSVSTHPRACRNSFLQSAAAKWNTTRWKAMLQVLNSNIDDEHRLSPSVSASYRIFKDRNLYVRLSAKSMFRMPTMTELYYYHIGSKTLRPETTKQLNMGVTWTFPFLPPLKGLEGGLSADLYINKVEDKIVCIPFNMFVSRFMNLDEVNGYGADVMLNIAWQMTGSQRLGMIANYSFQRVANDTDGGEHDGFQVAYMPLHSGSGTLSYESKWINAALTTTMASRMWTTNEHHEGTGIPGYWELAATLYRTFALPQNHKMTLACTCQNILDYEYCVVAHYPMPGRNWKISITYKF